MYCEIGAAASRAWTSIDQSSHINSIGGKFKFPIDTGVTEGIFGSSCASSYVE